MKKFPTQKRVVFLVITLIILLLVLTVIIFMQNVVFIEFSPTYQAPPPVNFGFNN